MWGVTRNRFAHDSEKHVLDLIGDGHRFSGKIMRESGASAGRLLRQKFAAVAQAFLVDAVADAG